MRSDHDVNGFAVEKCSARKWILRTNTGNQIYDFVAGQGFILSTRVELPHAIKVAKAHADATRYIVG